jgi:hypothetical protein
VKTPLFDRWPTDHTPTTAPTGPLAMQHTSPSVPLTRPVVQPKPTLSSSLPEEQVYRTYEKVMETKANALGMRREFFQFLQKKRDSVGYSDTLFKSEG